MEKNIYELIWASNELCMELNIGLLSYLNSQCPKTALLCRQSSAEYFEEIHAENFNECENGGVTFLLYLHQLHQQHPE